MLNIDCPPFLVKCVGKFRSALEGEVVCVCVCIYRKKKEKSLEKEGNFYFTIFVDTVNQKGLVYTHTQDVTSPLRADPNFLTHFTEKGGPSIFKWSTLSMWSADWNACDFNEERTFIHICSAYEGTILGVTRWSSPLIPYWRSFWCDVCCRMPWCVVRTQRLVLCSRFRIYSLGETVPILWKFVESFFFLFFYFLETRNLDKGCFFYMVVKRGNTIWWQSIIENLKKIWKSYRKFYRIFKKHFENFGEKILWNFAKSSGIFDKIFKRYR